MYFDFTQKKHFTECSSLIAIKCLVLICMQGRLFKAFYKVHMFPSDLVKLNVPFYLLSENLKVTLKMRSFSFKCQSHWQQPPLQLNYHLRFFQWPLQRSHQKYQRLLFLQALLWHQSLEGLSMTEWSMNIYQVSWKKRILVLAFSKKKVMIF